VTRAALAAIAVACVACKPPPRATRWPMQAGSSCDRTEPRFATLGTDAATLTVELRGDRAHEPYAYVVQREPAGVDVDLHAVVMTADEVFVAGDRGLVLHRTPTGAWTPEPTPTDRALRALLVATTDTEADTEAVAYAVGDGGTVLRRSPAGAWSRESTPTATDLHDVTAVDRRLYAVGDRGTLLERRGGVWQQVASHVDDDLRFFDGRTALGLHGAVVDCLAWDRDQLDLARLLACVPRPSPTTEDLFTRIERGDVYGASGAHLEVGAGDPLTLAAAPPLPGAPSIVAAVANHWLASVGNLPAVVVGRGGMIAFLPHGQPLELAVPDAPDLDDVAARELDVFAVGARGTIVHATTRGVTLPCAVLL